MTGVTGPGAGTGAGPGGAGRTERPVRPEGPARPAQPGRSARQERSVRPEEAGAERRRRPGFRRAGGSGPQPPAAHGSGRLRLTPAGRRRVLAALLALTLLVGGGTWLVYGSPWLRARKVSISGMEVLTEQQVREAAAVPLGGALVSVDTGAVRKRLLKALPRLKDARVRRSWPHTVRVEVTERVPSAVLKNGRGFTEVDREGVRFATVERRPRGVPVVELTPDQTASFRHFGTKRLLQAAISVAGTLPDSLAGQATVIRVRSYDAVTVELTGGRDVMWGSQEDGAAKAAALTALMKAEPKAGHYDVSAPTAPAASGG